MYYPGPLENNAGHHIMINIVELVRNATGVVKVNSLRVAAHLRNGKYVTEVFVHGWLCSRQISIEEHQYICRG